MLISCTTLFFQLVANSTLPRFALGNIIYAPFPKCFETDAPLTLRYGVDEVFNCTIDLGHEFFHIFQLYIHEDVPFSCRIPFTKTQNPSPAPPADSPEEKAAKLYTSFTFNIRGRVQESHLDIDPFLNMAAVVNTTAGSVTSAIAFSSGSTVQRFIIGDPLPLTLAVRWYPGPVLPTAKGAYFAGSATFYYSTATFIITAAACAAIFYYYVFPKKLREELKTTLPIAGQYYNTKSE